MKKKAKKQLLTTFMEWLNEYEKLRYTTHLKVVEHDPFIECIPTKPVKSLKKGIKFYIKEYLIREKRREALHKAIIKMKKRRDEASKL